MSTKTGTVNPNQTLASQGITGFKNAYYNLTEPDLIAQSIPRDEGELGIGGTLLVETGKFTGRSPKDKHIVVSDETPGESLGKISDTSTEILELDVRI